MREQYTALDAHHVEGGAGAGDVDDGIDRADFVKVDVFDAGAVDVGLDGRDVPEYVAGGFFCPFAE